MQTLANYSRIRSFRRLATKLNGIKETELSKRHRRGEKRIQRPVLITFQ